jgi:hypothetical protein
LIVELDEVLLAVLPAPSRAKLDAALIDQRAARAAYADASDRADETAREVGRIEAIVRQMLPREQFDTLGRPIAVVDAIRRFPSETAGLREPLEHARRQHQLALDAQERAASRQRSFAFLAGVERWLRAAGGSALRHHAARPPRAKDMGAEIARVRAEIAALDEEFASTKAAPAPADILRAQAVAEIDELAERGALRIAANDRTGKPLNLAAAISIGTHAVDTEAGRILGVGPGADGPAIPLWTWLHRDTLVKRVEAIIAALPQEGVLTDAQLAQRRAVITARKLDAERVEEATIAAAEKEGRPLERRRNLDPRAFLEIVED